MYIFLVETGICIPVVAIADILINNDAFFSSNVHRGLLLSIIYSMIITCMYVSILLCI